MYKKYITLAVSSITAATLYAPPVLANDQSTDTVTITSEEQNLTDKQRLMNKLAKIAQFSAQFKQQIIAEDGTELMPSTGKLAVKKPNLVYWHTELPEETTIVSDGSTLWFYDPFVEQVTAYSVNDSIANTPILLLTSTDETQWQNYQVSQTSAHSYSIASSLPDSRITALDLTFLADTNKLASFAFTDATGQKSIITLNNLESETSIPASKFKFVVPEGIYIDDQR